MLRRWAVMILIFVAGDYWFFPRLWEQEPFTPVAFLIMEFVMIFGLGWYAVTNIRSDQDFICRIDHERLECIAPARDCGESFNIRLADIDRLEEVNRGKSYSWDICTNDGRRFHLMYNYQNPVKRFLATIKALRPDVVETHR